MKMNWRDLVPGDEFFVCNLNSYSKVTEKYTFSNWVTHSSVDAVINAMEHKTGNYRLLNVNDYVWEEWYKEWLSWNPALPPGVTRIQYHDSSKQLTFQQEYEAEYNEPQVKRCTCGTSKTYGDNVDLSFHSSWCDLRN